MKYINKLTDEEWNKILKPAGYTLDQFNTAKSPNPYVDKGVDENGNEANEYLLHVLDTDLKANIIKYILFGTSFGIIPMINPTSYTNTCDIIAVDDYTISLLGCGIIDNEKINAILQESLTGYLKAKFPEYSKDYDKYLDTLDYGMGEDN